MDPDLFHELSKKLLDKHPGDAVGKMLHSPGLKTSGRFYAFATGEDLVVKLPAERVAELISTGLGRPCEPSRGRPMRQWVRLIPATEHEYVTYLTEARAYVASLPAKD